MRADPMMGYFTDALRGVITAASGGSATIPCLEPKEGKGRYVLRLVGLARSVTADDFFGLASTRCPLGSQMFMNEVAVRCTTLEEALEQAFRFIGLACPAAHFTLSRNAERAAIRIAIDGEDGQAHYLLSQWHMLTVHRLAQWLIGSEIPLDRVEFPNPMYVPYGDYAMLFGRHCEFNADTAHMEFPARFLNGRVIRTPRDLVQQFSAPQGNFADPKTLSRTWEERTRRALRIDLVTERPMSTIDELAEQFGISSQTLRRRLKAEGTSYRLLKADMRVEAALNAMSDDTPLSAASLKAGFAEPNGLTRALRTSSGLSSTDLLRQVRSWRAL